MLHRKRALFSLTRALDALHAPQASLRALPAHIEPHYAQCNHQVLPFSAASLFHQEGGKLVLLAMPRNAVFAPTPFIAARSMSSASLNGKKRREIDGWATMRDSFTTILADVDENSGIATLTINRPEVLNALNSKVMEELVSAALFLDRQHPGARVIVITGAGSKAFAAGADIKEMVGADYAEAYNRRMLNGWEALRSVRKPTIACINGFALGGGCELALLCDIAIAADTASLGQPELTLGVIPGMGGTQRLTRAVGKSRAMELILTGARISAAEAAKMGLISRAVPAEELVDEVRRVAAKIAQYSTPVVGKAKECVNAAFEMGLAEGIMLEKREFWSCFGLADQKEGMGAFLQKREPRFMDK